MKKFIATIILFMLSFFAYAHEQHLGKIDFKTSGNQSAQPYFERGVMKLHSFEYHDALLDFRKAREIDPHFALAYWGEAMTYNHPLWGEQDFAAAITVLNRLSPTYEGRVQKAKTTKEKKLINAINQLYGQGNKTFRDLAYLEKMHQLYDQYPNDDEIASFYALALLGATGTERDIGNYMKAAAIAGDIFSRNPLHPGALHYAIHAFDDPIHAPLGLKAARTYAHIAPDASHALHMPSHIFMALGMWDDVIGANKAAWEAGVKQNPTSDPKVFTVDDLHSLLWLSYGYLQKEEYRTAYLLTKIMENIAMKSNTPMAKWYYSIMRSAYILASCDFQADLKSLDMQNIELSARVNDLYVNALIALHQKNIKSAKAILNHLKTIIPNKIEAQELFSDYFTSISSKAINTANIMILELQAEIAMFEKKKAQAIQLLNEAITLENNMSVDYGPPIPVKPARELLAEYLMSEKKYREAYSHYVIALKRFPHRLPLEKGLKQAEKKFNATRMST